MSAIFSHFLGAKIRQSLPRHSAAVFETKIKDISLNKKKINKLSCEVPKHVSKVLDNNCYIHEFKENIQLQCYFHYSNNTNLKSNIIK